MTRADAQSLGYDGNDWASVVAVFRALNGTDRAPVDDPDGAVAGSQRLGEQMLLAPALEAAQLAIERGCADRLDVVVDGAQAHLDNVTRSLIAVERWHERTVSTTEDGTRYRLADAAREAAQLDRDIAADRALGRRHHERTSLFLRRLAVALLPVDVGAMAFMLGQVVNVDVTRPAADLLGSLTVGFLALAAPLTQFYVTAQAADDANELRQARAEERRGPAARARRRMLAWLAAALGVDAALVAFLVYRVWSVAHGGRALGPVGLAALITCTVVAGAAAPVLKFLAVAFDGSTLSRRRDDLNRQLEEVDAERVAVLADVRRSLDALEALVNDYQFLDRRAVLDDASAALEPGRRRVRLLRLMLGQGEPPVQAVGSDLWSLRSPVAGLDAPDHAPLQARDHRIKAVVDAADAARERLARLQPTRAVEGAA